MRLVCKTSGDTAAPYRVTRARKIECERLPSFIDAENASPINKGIAPLHPAIDTCGLDCWHKFFDSLGMPMAPLATHNGFTLYILKEPEARGSCECASTPLSVD